MEGWEHFVKDVKRFYNVNMDCLTPTFQEEQRVYYLGTSSWADVHPSQLLSSPTCFKSYDLATLTLQEVLQPVEVRTRPGTRLPCWGLEVQCLDVQFGGTVFGGALFGGCGRNDHPPRGPSAVRGENAPRDAASLLGVCCSYLFWGLRKKGDLQSRWVNRYSFGGGRTCFVL